MGVALDHTRMIAEELERDALVPLFDTAVPAPTRYVLCLASGVTTFRDRIRAQATRQAPA